MAGDKCKDGKISKESITILLACSSLGEKLTPLVVGKARKPRCFKMLTQRIYQFHGIEIKRHG